MKFDTLRLHPYGPFEDLSLDLAAGDGRIFCVFGENEAGKSTLLRAFQRFLFGFPHHQSQVIDDWRHEAGDLRLTATLTDTGGAGARTLTATRRKGRGERSLVGAGSSPLPEGALLPYLAGLDEAAFNRRFFLGHQHLRAGGAGLLATEGEAGATLYAAGLGVDPGRLARTQAALVSEAEELFKPGGKNPRLNQTLSRLKSLKDAVAARQNSAEAFARLETELGEAQAEGTRRATALAGVEAALREVERRAAIAAILKEWEALDAARKATAGVAPLPPEYRAEARVKAESARDAATRELEDLAGRREAAEAERDALDFDAARADALEAIQELRGRQDAFERDVVDAESFKRQAQRSVATAEALAAQLESDPARLDASGTPAEAALKKLEQLVREHAAQQGQAAKAEARLATAERDLRAATTAGKAAGEAAANDTAELRDEGHLRELQVAARAHRELLGRFLEQQERHAGDAARFEVEAARRLGPGATPAAVASRAFVPMDTLRAALAALEAAQRERTLRTERAAEAEAAVQRLRTELATLRALDGVPSLGELDAARAARDALITAAAQAAGRGVSHDFAPLQAAVAEADRLADRIRERADGLARRMERELRLAADVETARQTEAARVAAEAAHAAASAEVAAHLADAPLAGGPAGALVWRQAVEQLVGTATALQEAGARLARLEAQVEAGRAELAAQGHDPGLRPDTAARVETALTHRLDALQKSTQAAALREQQLRTLQRQLDEARHEMAGVAAERATWTQAWHALLDGVALPTDTPPEAAEQHLRGRLRYIEAREGARKAEEAAGERGRRVRAHLDAVATLAARLGEPAPGAEQAAAFLTAAVESARREAGRRTARQRVVERLDDLSRQQTAQRRRLEEAEAALAHLCALAGVSTPDALPAREQAAEARAEAERNLAALTRRLLDKGVQDGDPERARALLWENGTEPLDARAAALRLERAQCEAELKLAREAVGALTERRRVASDEAGCEGAAEEAAGLLARARGDAARYLRLRSAVELLRRAIAHHRRDVQGPVLQRAGALFSRLTLGRFAGLDLQEDESDPERARIVAMRPDKVGVPVTRLSDGAQDQLYLSVVLTYLERHLDAHGPMPIILDDAFVHFDDPRATVAFEVLAELATRTQVLYFTHHAHLLDVLARAVPHGHAVHRLTPPKPHATEADPPA